MIDELIWKSQHADIEAFEKKMKADRAAEEALRAKRRAPGEMGLNKLLEKMYGSEPVPELAVPKPAAQPQGEAPNVARPASAFPPPPSSFRK